METTTATIGKLIEKAEVYGKTTLEICKCNAIYKVANLFSLLAIKLVLLLVAVSISLMFNIGLALFLGEFLDKTYYGFFLITGFYVLVGIVIFLYRKQWIKHPVRNFIIGQALNKN